MTVTAHTATPDKGDVWARISAPLPAGAISWRQDGRPIARDGKYTARFVAYVDAQTVRERLDAIVPGEWTLTLDLLPSPADDDGVALCAFKARLSILGVIREDVGQGKDYKTASSDAFKRAAVRFGVAHELYAYEQNWVQVDGDGKFAKPLEDPGEAYARRLARNGNGSGVKSANAVEPSRGQRAESNGGSDAAMTTPARQQPAPEPPDSPLATDEPSCPKCGGRLWDNRISKRNPKAPDWKCRSRSCDGVIWPAKSGQSPRADDAPLPDEPYEDDRSLPF